MLPADMTDRIMERVRLEKMPILARSGWTVRKSILAAAACLLVALAAGLGFRLNGQRSHGDEILVRFEVPVSGAGNVFLVGDFTQWETGRLPLRDENRDGVWEITVRLEKGRVYAYNFLIDGTTWITDPSVTNQVDDGFGGKNSVITL